MYRQDAQDLPPRVGEHRARIGPGPWGQPLERIGKALMDGIFDEQAALADHLLTGRTRQRVAGATFSSRDGLGLAIILGDADDAAATLNELAHDHAICPIHMLREDLCQGTEIPRARAWTEAGRQIPEQHHRRRFVRGVFEFSTIISVSTRDRIIPVPRRSVKLGG